MICSECGKPFRYPGAMKSHIEKHFRDNPQMADQIFRKIMNNHVKKSVATAVESEVSVEAEVEPEVVVVESEVEADAEINALNIEYGMVRNEERDEELSVDQYLALEEELREQEEQLAENESSINILSVADLKGCNCKTGCWGRCGCHKSNNRCSFWCECLNCNNNQEIQTSSEKYDLLAIDLETTGVNTIQASIFATTRMA